VSVVAIGIALGFSVLADKANLAPIIGAFVAGLALRRIAAHERVERDVSSIAQIFVPIFFLNIGISTDISAMADARVIGVALVLSAIAIVAIEILHLLNSQRGLVQITFALLFVGIAMSYFLPGPYWVYVTFLTPGVILLDSNSVSNQDDVALSRIAFTVGGIAIALVIGFIVHRSYKFLARHS
jgi:Kef-type K+ transport system membrane component KefB